MSLEERYRERLGNLVDQHAWVHEAQKARLLDAILREFALRPVAQGKVGEDGLVTTDS